METPRTYFPPTAHFVYCQKARVDWEIFYPRGQKYVIDTGTLRDTYRRIVLILDGYGSQHTFKLLHLLKEYGIVVVGLPSYTSHWSQMFEFSVFSSYHMAFRIDVNRDTLLVKDEVKNYVYNIWKLLTLPYSKALKF